MSAFKSKIELMHLVGDREGLLLECSVGYLELRQLKLRHTWQLTACLLQLSTAGCPQAVQISITTVVIKAVASGQEGPRLNGTYKCQKFSSCHDFSVKLSLCICSHTESSCPSRWHTYAIPGYLW